MNIFLVLHFIPVIIGLYIYFIIPYLTLKKGSSLSDYFDNLMFESIPTLTLLLILPVFNYIVMLKVISDFNVDTEQNECLEETVSNIYDFFKEFIIALWMLIVWLFGLKYIYKLFNKILKLKIK